MRSRTAARGRSRPLLARLRVGTKLMVLALLPVCGLVAFAVVAGLAEWQQAGRLTEFRAAAQISSGLGQVANDLGEERIATLLAELEPGASTRAQLAAAQRTTARDLQAADRQATGTSVPVDVAGRLDAARRQRDALLSQAATGPSDLQQVADGYGAIVTDLLDTIRDLDTASPSAATGRAADAYLAIQRAVEAAASERCDIALLLAPHGIRPQPTASRWETLEATELDTFREDATGPLAADLQAALFSPSGLAVQQVRDELRTNPAAEVSRTSLRDWVSASGVRIAALRSIAHGAQENLRTAVSDDLGSARARAFRDLAISLAVLVSVSALAFALRRSITGPLREVSEGARTLSGGDLRFDVRYTGRDEIGDVAAAFRDLHLTAERLAEEICAMNTAIRENRLDHRADRGTFGGTWAELVAGMNNTMAAFAELQQRRLRAERETTRIFDMSLDPLGIGGFDGYFRRVNPAFEHMLGYPSDTLLSRPTREFVHPEDRDRMTEAHAAIESGAEFARFELRQVCGDGSVRWVEWSARPVPDEGVIYAVGRDVTESRRAREQQAALRRVATLVARGEPSSRVFAAVAEEVCRLLAADISGLARYEDADTMTIVAVCDARGDTRPAGYQLPIGEDTVARRVRSTGRPATVARFPEGSAAASLGIRSAVGVPVMVRGRPWGLVTVALTRDEPPDPGTESRLADFSELVATAIANAEAQAELTASRARIVATADQTRRRIERDIHDGVQQRLVSLALQLRAAQAAVPPEHSDLTADLDRVVTGLTSALDELRELTRGIHPAMLTEGGLGPALKSLTRRCAVPVQLNARTSSRLPEPVEVAAYYVVSEALTNAAKHASASAVAVDVEPSGDVLRISVRDDGVGGADFTHGSGLVGLKDRVQALGGQITIDSPRGVGTSLSVTLPLGAADGSSAPEH